MWKYWNWNNLIYTFFFSRSANQKLQDTNDGLVQIVDVNSLRSPRPSKRNSRRGSQSGESVDSFSSRNGSTRGSNRFKNSTLIKKIGKKIIKKWNPSHLELPNADLDHNVEVDMHIRMYDEFQINQLQSLLSKKWIFFFVKLKFNRKKQKFSNYFFRLRVSDRPTPYGLKRLLDDLDSGSSSLPGKSSRKNREFSISRKKKFFSRWRRI